MWWLIVALNVENTMLVTCHDALNTYPFVPVSLDTEETAVCCGVCLHQMTPAQYLHAHYQCPKCHHLFNVQCALHKNTYFC